MKELQKALLEDLALRTAEVIRQAEALAALPLERLNYKINSEKWSALECIEHLNRYARFYHRELQEQLNTAVPCAKTVVFRSGWLGNYFANSLLPGKGGRMRTFKNMNPNHSKLDLNVLQEFLKGQRELMELLKRAGAYDLNQVKTAITISKFIRLKAGDTFRVIIYHNQRHLGQATTAAAQINA
jgi:hypothetical protein